jgi:RNA polymerase sigma factor (sigma-70 family)
LLTKVFTDKELIENYLSGDESCLETLVRRHKKAVFYNILKVVRNRQLADDLFQDTFIKVINLIKLGKYREKGKFLAWVLTISRNMVMDYLRKNCKSPVINIISEDIDIFAFIGSSDLNIEEKMISKQIQSDIRHLIQYLPQEQKEIIFLRHYKGLTYREIAGQTNVNISTTIGRMRYALRNLRKVIKEKEIVLTK